MPQIEVINTGIVYRGAQPDTPTGQAYMPTIVRRDDGVLVVVMNLGTAASCRHTRAYCTRSADEGKTWSSPEKLFEPDESAHPVQAGVRISRTGDGGIIGFTTLLDRSRVDEPRTNPQTGGSVEMQHAIVRSDDGGHTWSPPQLFDSPLDWHCYGEPSPIVPLRPDRWLLPSLTRLDWDGHCPLGLKAFVMISHDQGRTWPKAVDVFDHWAEGIICWEQKQIRLTDGRIFAVTWAFNSETKENLRNLYTFSEDDGESYAPSMQSPLHGQTCTPFALADNHILCVYRRSDRNGLWAHLARIDGDAWQAIADAPLWGADVAAMASGLDSSIQNQLTLKFGYPMMTALPNGDVFVVFWCVEDGQAVIRWFRVGVEV